jgi:D-beta-D-heptose 7-phosphate kinase/D-beta-D-heptose 1-phosphate adenosyltransferase
MQQTIQLLISVMFDCNLLQNIKKKTSGKILCIGDVALDKFIYGTVERVSSERPIPVMKYSSESKFLGCMGNVLGNIKSLGGDVDAIFVTGDDQNSEKILELIENLNIKYFHFVDKTRKTTVKERYICGQQQLFRFDIEDSHEISQDLQQEIIKQVKKIINNYKIIVLSDYNQGILTADLCHNIIDIANQNNVKVFVDPRSESLIKYRGSFLVKPNLQEFKQMFTTKISNKKDISYYIDEWMGKNKIVENLLITLGNNGMVLCGQKSLEIEAIPVNVYDVCGAGDTVLATLVTCYSAGIELDNCCKIANIAGSLAVAKFGTATITINDLEIELEKYNKSDRKKIYYFDNDIDVENLIQVINHKKSDKKIVGFTNGCFDILHTGHVSLLEQAKRKCDFLIVAINDDFSVKKNKGDSRPINNQESRAMIINSIKSVDIVIIFSEKTVDNLILQLKPNKWFKGGDYKGEDLPEYKSANQINCEVDILPFSEGFSTTNIINKINNK